MVAAFMRGLDLYRHLASEGVIGRGRKAVERSQCCSTLQECLDAGVQGRPGGIRPEDFSLRNLAASLIVNRTDGQPVGESFIQENFDPRDPHPLQEAMGAVDATAFVGVQGQILINRLLQMYEQEDFVTSKMITPTPTVLNGERIPGVARPGDPGEDVTLVREGQEYNTVGFGEEYVETPMTTKHGEIIAITREAVFFDRTGMVLQRAALVGEILGLSKEKRLLQTIIGAVNSYREKRKGDPAPVNLSTYYAADDAGPVDQPLRRRRPHRLHQPGQRRNGLWEHHRPEHGRADHCRRLPTAPAEGPAPDHRADSDRHATLPLDHAAERAGHWRHERLAGRHHHRRQHPARDGAVGGPEPAVHRADQPGAGRVDGRRGQLLVLRQLPEGLRLHGKLADHRGAGPGQQRGRVHARHPLPLEGVASGARRPSSTRVSSSGTGPFPPAAPAARPGR